MALTGARFVVYAELLESKLILQLLAMLKSRAGSSARANVVDLYSQAVKQLGELGADGAAYVPKLIDMSNNDKDPDVGQEAAQALKSIAKAICATLLDDLPQHHRFPIHISLMWPCGPSIPQAWQAFANIPCHTFSVTACLQYVALRHIMHLMSVA